LRHIAVRADGRELRQPGPVLQVAEQRARGFRASLVFPEPPGPIRVVSRCSAMSSRTTATSASLPTKLVSSARKLVFHRSQAQPLEPGDRCVKRDTILQTDVLHGRTAPQREGLAQQPYAPRILVFPGLADEALEPHGVDRVGFRRQPVAVRLPLDYPVRQRLSQRETKRCKAFVASAGGCSPQIQSMSVAFGTVTWFEREGDQQPAQPGARHVGEGAVVRASLE
jgi:hypothetical protein